MPHPAIPRRALLASTLAGCTGPLPASLPEISTPDGRALLDRAAEAHGRAAFGALRDVAVSYDGTWAPLIEHLQPVLVDKGHRGTSEERLLLRDGLVAQAHRGPTGGKTVLRRWAPGSPGEIRVLFDGEEARDEDRRAAAALVADGYALFLLGPLLLAGPWAATRAVAVERGGGEDIVVGGHSHVCDLLHVRVAPGLGFAASDRIALYLDRDEGLMRRVRFSLDGMASTRGAVAEVDAWDHVAVGGGTRFPTRFHERLLRPLQMPVHDWRVTGLDLDRGLDAASVDGVFRGRAESPARPTR